MPNQESKRDFEPPVAWLLGRQLMASLKSTLLYTAFGNKIDARDWMDARVFPSSEQEEANEAWKTMHAREKEQPTAGGSGGHENEQDFWNRGEFWFDYISDTGDGMTATYSVAYLCLSNLWLRDPGTEKPPGDTWVNLEHQGTADGKDFKLPRGEFLLVGGDTSYHLSDYESLHTRFQLPFTWAYQDLKKSLGQEPKAEDEMTEDEKEEELRHLRPLFGIPGNHDYYDMLDGFRRQFRVPTRTRAEDKTYENPLEYSQLRMPGFKRCQQTSYVALRLPFGWMLWGLDTEIGKLDERQRDFFKGLNSGRMPNRLIVCTSAPTTVFGKFADKDDEKSAKAFLQLGLPRPFLRSENDKNAEQPKVPEKPLGADEIRLDLAGDVHHYARYWGPPSQNTQPTRTHVAHKKPLQATNYASVMSGLGGAFHHPSTTYVDQIREQALYPNEDDSRREVAGHIFNPGTVLKGGGVWFLGGIIALILSFAAIANDSSRPAIHNFGLFTWFGITPPDQYDATASSNEEAKKNQADVKPSLWRQIGWTTESWTPQFPNTPDCNTDEARKHPIYLWGRCKTDWPWEYTLGFLVLLSTIPTMGAAIGLTRRQYRASKEQQEVGQKARKEGQQVSKDPNDAIVRKVNWTLWSFSLLTAILVAIGVLTIMPYRHFITPFGNSLLVLLSIAWAGSAMYLSLQYSDWLFLQAAKRKIRRRDWWITWVLSAFAFIGLAIGLWVFGKNNLAAYLVSDILLVLIVIAVPILLYFAAVKLGGAHQAGAGKWGMRLIGIWHAILQLGVALFLIKKGTWLTVVLATIVILVFWLIGKNLMRANRRWWLTIAWVLFGASMLLLPPLVYSGLIKYRDRLSPELLNALFWPHTFNPSLPFASYEWWLTFGGWKQLVPILTAAGFGSLLACVWLGWYFAVCLVFNGHNNETGGAARIERFKQMIRFRLSKDELTGYVIAVDDPKQDGAKLRPKIIDIFHLKIDPKATP